LVELREEDSAHKMSKTSWRAKIFTLSSFFLGIILLILAVTQLDINKSGNALLLQNREKRRAEEKLKFEEENKNLEEEGSTSWIEDYYDSQEGSGSHENDGLWVSLIEQLDGESPVSLKKTGGTKRERKVLREKNREGRKLKRQQSRSRNRVTGPNFQSLSRKSLARAEKRLKEMWNQQASEWTASDERSWEFGSFQDQEILQEIGKLPDEFSGHLGHDDLAPAVNTLLETGRCEAWRGSERPMNIYFAVQNNLPLHSNNKRSDFGHMMEFIGDISSQIDLKNNRVKIFEYNERDVVDDAIFSLSFTSNKRNNRNRQLKQLRKSSRQRPTLARPQIKPIIEKLNSVMSTEKNTLMSGSTNVVILFITNIPGDLHTVDSEYLNNQIEELNSKAFVIVIFVHPMSHNELRTVPYRILPKSWTHGLRDNEFAQRILVKNFSELASNNNKAMVNAVRSMLCLVDERLQCRLSNKPWADGQRAMQMRSSPMIDSCCGHEIAAKAYDSRFKTCCRDGSVKSWLTDGTNPCGSNQL